VLFNATFGLFPSSLEGTYRFSYESIFTGKHAIPFVGYFLQQG
jgi:hypothetical protein